MNSKNQDTNMSLASESEGAIEIKFSEIRSPSNDDNLRKIVGGKNAEWRDDDDDNDDDNDNNDNNFGEKEGGNCMAAARGFEKDFLEVYDKARGNDNDWQLRGGDKAATAELDGFEKDFFNIFDKARDYRMRIEELEGGRRRRSNLDSDKPKRKSSVSFTLNLDIAKKLKPTLEKMEKVNPSPKKENLQIKAMKISKMILDDIKKTLGIEKIDESNINQVRKEAMNKAENPEQYVHKYNQQSKNNARINFYGGATDTSETSEEELDQISRLADVNSATSDDYSTRRHGRDSYGGNTSDQSKEQREAMTQTRAYRSYTNKNQIY